MKLELRYPGQWALDAQAQNALALFRERADEFQRLGRFAYPVESAIHVINDTVRVEADIPSELHLISAARSARFFFMQDEPTNYGRICDHLWQGTAEARFRQAISAARAGYNAILKKAPSFATTDSHPCTRRDLLEAYLHGEMFHSDHDLRRIVKALEAATFGPLHRQEFARILMDIRSSVQELLPVALNALGIDLLARCDASRAIQIELARTGIGPCAITIGTVLDNSVHTPRAEMRCELDINLGSECRARLMLHAAKSTWKFYPGFPAYWVWWKDGKGAPVGVRFSAEHLAMVAGG